MPTLFSIFGLRFYVYTEEHKPIHIHVRKGKAKAKFLLNPIKLLENKGLKDQEVSLAKSLIEENKDIIIDHWKNAENFKRG
ncbi:MAG: DUF4160 domain-containing protein [Fibromonadaceae bacterium]|jgi:hypothetical protein|nr:DUF4160 domain-containing protein [Fibromonadaceae bacterium]